MMNSGDAYLFLEAVWNSEHIQKDYYEMKTTIVRAIRAELLKKRSPIVTKYYEELADALQSM